MSSPLTPLAVDPSTPAAVVVPSPGDNRTAASVATPIQALYNMVFWIYGVLTGVINQIVTIRGRLNVQGLTVITDLNATGGIDSATYVECGTDLSAGRDLDVARNARLRGLVTLGDRVTCTDTARLVRAAHVFSTSLSEPDPDPAVASMWFFGTLAANATTLMTDSEGVNGDEFEFVTDHTNTAYAVNLTVNSISVSLRYAANHPWRARFKKIAGSWKLIDYTMYDPVGAAF